jgi:hypothetical protein
MDPFPAICPTTRSYGPGQATTSESFASMFLQGETPVGILLTLEWRRIHVTQAAAIMAHQRESKGLRAFLLPPAAWGDHPEPNEIAEGVYWKYDTSSPISQSGGGPFVSLTVNLISTHPST